MKIGHTITLCFFISLSSCGKKDDDRPRANATVVTQERTDEGTFRAILAPVNPTLNHETTGTVEVRITGDDVRVSSSIAGAPRGVKHYQNIMTGRRCPATDANADGVIDVAETLTASGAFLVPLDSDLANQLEGMDFGPIANSAGAYVYRRSTTLSFLLDELSRPDPDRFDAVAKLAPGAPIALEGRAVIVFGVAADAGLPRTAATLGGERPESHTPIACGVLVRVPDEGQ
jgi:hypothetical protein